jgi:hypothetical protein
METATDDTSPPAARVARTLELVREVERVLHEMNTDLTLAEAKLAKTRELIAQRRERAATSA